MFSYLGRGNFYDYVFDQFGGKGIESIQNLYELTVLTGSAQGEERIRLLDLEKFCDTDATVNSILELTPEELDYSYALVYSLLCLLAWKQQSCGSNFENTDFVKRIREWVPHANKLLPLWNAHSGIAQDILMIFSCWILFELKQENDLMIRRLYEFTDVSKPTLIVAMATACLCRKQEWRLETYWEDLGPRKRFDFRFCELLFRSYGDYSRIDEDLHEE